LNRLVRAELETPTILFLFFFGQLFAFMVARPLNIPSAPISQRAGVTRGNVMNGVALVARLRGCDVVMQASIFAP